MTETDYFPDIIYNKDYIMRDKRIKQAWITTNKSNLQFRKATTSSSTFEFKEFDRKSFPEEFEKYEGSSDLELKEIWDNPMYWIECTINLNETVTEDVLAICLGYGIEITDDNEDIAKLIFEQTNGLY